MAKYALPINDDTLDLVTVLNNGVRPEIEDETTCFVFETDPKDVAKNPEIKLEDDMYEDGYTIDPEVHWLIG